MENSRIYKNIMQLLINFNLNQSILQIIFQIQEKKKLLIKDLKNSYNRLCNLEV